ncbi:tyrosine-protein phosphatase [Lactobacillus sp. ESL0785]|uniref:tyrosine-protein phosphatase n=1 Tax=Lactobacillus sp. ESL0785 TaxID=2983232 RepID=UPI0023F85D9D|nr:tyrosine-protein phosphatase [Lactobacillus sp. ESL0785]WEV71092.1 tyrosine-protein phosphatase [Lactobacillus sp. ESL0785]
MASPVILPVKSVRNPRDLGGYVGLNGHKIKTHRLLRTGNISKITAHDCQFLLDYGLTKVIDLRSPAECQINPDQEISGVLHYHCPLAVDGGNEAQNFARYRADQYASLEMMYKRYREHVLTKTTQASFHQILKLMAETTEGAVLYHCSEGKDRTGLVTLMILHVLGVAPEVIRQDYLYSNYLLNDYRAIRDQRFKLAGENDNFRANMRILGSVADAFLDTSLIAINKNYGSLDSYIEHEVGIDQEMQDTIREQYLEK